MKLEIIKLRWLAKINNTLCNIGIHKWVYKRENVSYYLGDKLPGVSRGEILIPTDVRKCNRCLRKEHKPYMYSKWKYFNLYTTEEKRDSKLKMLIGEIE